MSSTKRNNYFLYYAVFSANIIAFYCGITFSWTSSIIPKLRSNDTNINPIQRPVTVFEESLLASIFVFGTIISAFVSGFVSQRFGRKRTLVGFSSGLLISFVMCIFSTQISVFLIARVIMGLGTGCILSTLPSYVGEITEDSIRGISASMIGILFCIGHFINFSVGPFVSIQMLNIIALVPLLLYYVTFVPFVPESPYYFMSIDDITGAKRSLRKLRSSSVIGEELKLISLTIEETKANKFRIADIFKSRVTLKALLVSCGCLGLQQLSGGTAVQAYLQSIFDESGGFIPSEYSVMIIGVVQLLGNVTATFLVDRAGRKFLLACSSAGGAVSLIFLGAYFYLKDNDYSVQAITWLPVTSLVVFFFSINMGLASIPWVINSEVFSSNVKSIATSITTSFNLLVTFLVTAFFPYMFIILSIAGTFWVFAALLLLGIVFIIVVVPETKGKSFSEIQELLLGNGKL